GAPHDCVAQPDRHRGAQPPEAEVPNVGVLMEEAKVPETETLPRQGIRIRTEVREPAVRPGTGKVAIEIKDLNLNYGENHVLHDVSMEVGESMVTAFIGPSGCGKSTLLRCLNRMNDLIDDTHITGKVTV